MHCTTASLSGTTYGHVRTTYVGLLYVHRYVDMQPNFATLSMNLYNVHGADIENT